MYKPFSQQLRYERELRGWSQADVAEQIGTDPKTVQRWESGKRLPRAYLRQELCKLFGKNAEEFGLITKMTPPEQPSQAIPETMGLSRFHAPDLSEEMAVSDKNNPSLSRPFHEDLGEVPSIEHFYGREYELETLREWIDKEHCRVVAILGMGGIGKTSLVAQLCDDIKRHFTMFFWRSLHNALPFQQYIQQAIQFFSHQQQGELPQSSSEQIAMLIQYLRQYHCLLVLDNFESLFEAGQRTGRYREGYEAYGQLLKRVGEANHSSCVIVTGREKPNEIVHLEGITLPVRSLSLAGMGQNEGRALIEREGIIGQDEEWAILIQRYAGNPLALKLVSSSIRTLFRGSIAHFLEEQENVFGDINDLLERQFLRLTESEQELLYWLAIEREAVSMNVLRENLVQPLSKKMLLEALDSLYRRSLVETGNDARFQLQPVIMEYLTGKLIEQAYNDFVGKTMRVWIRFGLIKAQAKEYLQSVQLRYFLQPLVEQLLATMGKTALKRSVDDALTVHRHKPFQQHDYLAANILHLFLYVNYDLRGYDFSSLCIRQAYLQNVLLPQVNFSHAHFLESIFTNTFGSILTSAFHPNGTLLGIGTTKGDIWLYRTDRSTPLLMCSGHIDSVWSLSFHPSGNIFASGSDDQTVRLWNTSTGRCIQILRGHQNRVRTVAFHPDGNMLVSGSDDGTVRIWDVQTGQCIRVLEGHASRVWAVAYSPDKSLLASGSTDGCIRIWDAETGQCLQILTDHTDSVRSIAFHRDSVVLASGSDDKTIRLWNARVGELIAILEGHINRVWSVAFSSSSGFLASGSEDQNIRLWDIYTRHCLYILQGHTHGIRTVAFHPTESLLASGGEDQSVRLWYVDDKGGSCLRTIHGYTNRIWSLAAHFQEPLLISCSEDRAIRLWNTAAGQCLYTRYLHEHGVRCIAFHADGHTFASGGEDQTVRLWQTETGYCQATLSGHDNWVWTVAFNPNGKQLASGSEDRTIRLWNIQTGQCVHVLREHTDWVRTLAFSPSGTLLASGGDDRRVILWDSAAGRCLQVLEGHTNRVRAIAFHPDSHLLASSGEDDTIRLWQIETGKCISILEGHSGWVRSIAFSADGHLLASGGEDRTINVWSVETGQCLAALKGHTDRVRSITFRSSGYELVSGSDDGTIRIWKDITSNESVVLHCERPYEGMNITNASGLSEAQKSTLLALGSIEVFEM